MYFITLLKYNYTSLLQRPFLFSTVSTQGSPVVNDCDGGKGEGGIVASGIKRPLGKWLDVQLWLFKRAFSHLRLKTKATLLTDLLPFLFLRLPIRDILGIFLMLRWRTQIIINEKVLFSLKWMLFIFKYI